jgi:hypothetical protein
MSRSHKRHGQRQEVAHHGIFHVVCKILDFCNKLSHSMAEKRFQQVVLNL